VCKTLRERATGSSVKDYERFVLTVLFCSSVKDYESFVLTALFCFVGWLSSSVKDFETVFHTLSEVKGTDTLSQEKQRVFTPFPD
jgi:hypothetical protein